MVRDLQKDRPVAAEWSGDTIANMIRPLERLGGLLEEIGWNLGKFAIEILGVFFVKSIYIEGGLII